MITYCTFIQFILSCYVLSFGIVLTQVLCMFFEPLNSEYEGKKKKGKNEQTT
jgi:hypothetical protein